MLKPDGLRDRLRARTARLAKPLLAAWTEPRRDPAPLAAVRSDPLRPVCYVLHQPSWANRGLIEAEIEALGLPPLALPMASPHLREDESCLVLTAPTPEDGGPAAAYPDRLRRLAAAVMDHDGLDVLLVPVSVFWGRAPDDESSILRLLTRDTWALAGPVAQAAMVALNGKEAVVRFGQPLSLRELCRPGQDAAALTRLAARILRVHFRRQRELVLGPDLSHQRNLATQILRGPAVRAAMSEQSAANSQPLAEVRHQARGYVREIAADYAYPVIRAMELGLDWFLGKQYDGIDVRNFSRVEAVSEDCRLVYLPCHRSQLDGLIVGHTVMKRGLMPPHSAAGINLNVPVIGPVIRRSGGFFLRRTFKDNPLYGAVLTEYVHAMTQAGFPVAYYIEAGRSRTGFLLPPRMGMLMMTARSYLRDHRRPLAFVPVYLGYERLIERASYVGEMQGAGKKKESVTALLATLRRARKGYGRLALNFGEPIRLDEHFREDCPDWEQAEWDGIHAPDWLYRSVGRLAQRINRRINDSVAVNPVTLLSTVLLAAPKHTLEESLLLGQLDLYLRLARALTGPDASLTDLSAPELIAYGEQLNAVRRIPHAMGDLLAAPDGEAVFLSYFRNNVLHVFILPALLASVLQTNRVLPLQDVEELAAMLYPYLQAELFLSGAAETVDERLRAVVPLLAGAGLLTLDGPRLVAPEPHTPQSRQLALLGAIARPTLERYYLTLCVLARAGSGRIDAAKLAETGSLLAQRLALLYEGNAPDFFDPVSFRQFIATLRELGLVQEDERQRLTFGAALTASARRAEWVLDGETLAAIQQLTGLDPVEGMRDPD